MYTIAVIGLGNRIAGVVHHLFQAAQGRLRMIGWADPSPVGIGSLQGHGIEPGAGYEDAWKMLTELKPDAVLIGSPNHLHLEHIRLALEAGCTVFSEKPVVISNEETLELARLLAKYGMDRLHVGLVLRSSPQFRVVQDLVRVGRIGSLISFEANEHLGPEHGGFLMRDWRRYRRYAGSYLLEKCCHDFDLYNALVGQRAVRVASFGGRDIFRPVHAALMEGAGMAPGVPRYHQWGVGWEGVSEVFGTDADTVDNQVALVEYEGGARLSFHSNAHCAQLQRRWLLIGTHGSIESDLTTHQIRYQSVFGASEVIPIHAASGSHYGADEQMGKDLAVTLLDGRPFPVSARASLEAGLLCMAIDLAQREGRVVDLVPWWEALDGALAGGLCANSN